MIRLRKQLIHWLFEISMKLYCRFKKKEAWGISTQQLLCMPSLSFGYALGKFLYKNAFELIPKVERHDAYHVLTGFGTEVEDEIALQYLCYGNGKRTPYLFAVLCLGSLILPDYLPYYRSAFRLGKRSNSFHHFDFKKILPLEYQLFRDTIFSEVIAVELAQLQRRFHTQLKPTLL